MQVADARLREPPVRRFLKWQPLTALCLPLSVFSFVLVVWRTFPLSSLVFLSSRCNTNVQTCIST